MPEHSMMEEVTPKEKVITENNQMANNDNVVNDNVPNANLGNNNANIANNNNNNVNNLQAPQQQQQQQLLQEQQPLQQAPLQQQQQQQQQNIIEQPVEIYRRIIHVEKPKIVEVPIYKEIHEYIREEPQYVTLDTNVIEEDLGTRNVSQLSPEERNRLQQYANNGDLNNNNQEADIILEKEQVTLATEIRQLPTQVHEKQIIYEQPIEIERRHIETIKPTVHEQVKIINEHVSMKDEPETKVADTVVINQGHQYFTKDVAKDLELDGLDTISTTSTNISNNNVNNNASLKDNTSSNNKLEEPILQQ